MISNYSIVNVIKLLYVIYIWIVFYLSLTYPDSFDILHEVYIYFNLLLLSVI